MKHQKKNKNVAKVIWAILFLMLLIGCQNQSPVAPMQHDNSGNLSSFLKPPVVDNTYPQTGEHTYTYWSSRDIYRGGSLMMPNGTVVNLTAGALTPPSSIPWGEDITITCTIEKDEINNELIFTFGPSGCQFNPAARVFLDYNDLNIEIPHLYYIDENGNYIQQQPDDIDVTNKNIILYIDHFSRYAIGDTP